MEAASHIKKIPITQASIRDNANELLSHSNGNGIGGLSDYDHIRITKEKNIVQPQPTITIGEAAIACPGNISAIGAAAKAGKTALVGVVLAGAISETGDVDGFSEFKVLSNPDQKAVISFDSEQSEADQQYNVKTILKRAGIERTPDHFRAYNIRQLMISEYQQVTTTICDLCEKKFNGIHLIVIDGGADYILSVNDESAASLIVQFFIHLAIKHACPVVVIVHQNPGSEKERGHFGSEIQRKCYGLLTLTREGDISTLSPKIMRKAGNADVPLISFKYDSGKGYHVAVDTVDKEDQKAKKDRMKHEEIASAIFKPLVALTYQEAVSQIMQATSKGERTAKTMISNMKGWGYIKKHDDGRYRLNEE